jgi:hypothetical protein
VCSDRRYDSFAYSSETSDSKFSVLAKSVIYIYMYLVSFLSQKNHESAVSEVR